MREVPRSKLGSSNFFVTLELYITSLTRRTFAHDAFENSLELICEQPPSRLGAVGEIVHAIGFLRTFVPLRDEDEHSVPAARDALSNEAFTNGRSRALETPLWVFITFSSEALVKSLDERVDICRNHGDVSRSIFEAIASFRISRRVSTSRARL